MGVCRLFPMPKARAHAIAALPVRSVVVLAALLGAPSAAHAQAVDRVARPNEASPIEPLPPLPPPDPPPQSPIVPLSPAPVPAAKPIPPPVAPCEAPCEDGKKKPPSPGSAYVGVRVRSAQTKATSGSSDAIGVTFAGGVETHNDDTSHLASRAGLDFGIGGGTGDVEGVFGGALLLGARAPVAVHHAPFVRVGVAGEYQGNSKYLYSRFDLPLGELGYQFVREGTLFELGARVSPVLTGRLRSGADTRELTSAFSAGGFLTARGEAGRVDLLYTRVQASDGYGRGVDTFQGIGCLIPFGAFSLCLDGQILSTSYGAGGLVSGEHFVATFGGLIGFGVAGLR
jgi:hypothetical protein